MEAEHVSTKRILVVLLGAALGTFLEFYSFALIGFFQQQVSKAFFPPTPDPTKSLLQSFTLFGIAFIARPFGGIVFGYIGDKYGRIQALRLSILVMCLPTFCIGCTPTFSTIGYWSTAIVFTLRFIQGFAAGGEMASAMIYVIEHTNRKGLYLAILVIFGMGEIFALILYKWTSSTMDGRTFNTIGFRIPFFVSLLIVLVAVFMRYLLSYSPEFEMMRQRQMILTNPLSYAIKNNKKEILIVSLSQLAGPMLYQVVTQWTTAWLFTIKNDAYAYDVLLAAYIGYLPIIALFGWLCDLYNAYSVTMYSGIFAGLIMFIGFSGIAVTSDVIMMSVLHLLMGMGIVCIGVPSVVWGLLYLHDPRTRAIIFGFSFNVGPILIIAYSFDICTVLQSLSELLGGLYVAIFCNTILLISLGAIWYGNMNPCTEYCEIKQSEDEELTDVLL